MRPNFLGCQASYGTHCYDRWNIFTSLLFVARMGYTGCKQDVKMWIVMFYVMSCSICDIQNKMFVLKMEKKCLFWHLDTWIRGYMVSRSYFQRVTCEINSISSATIRLRCARRGEMVFCLGFCVWLYFFGKTLIVVSLNSCSLFSVIWINFSNVKIMPSHLFLVLLGTVNLLFNQEFTCIFIFFFCDR